MRLFERLVDVELLHEGHSEVYRARLALEGRPVVVKRLRARYPDRAVLARFRREFDILQSAAGEGVPGTLAFDIEDGEVAYAMVDDGAASLRRHMASSPPSLRDSLRVVASIARTLSRLHRMRIIHKDVNPSNVLILGSYERVELIDFGMSSVLGREEFDARPPELFEGTPVYAAPEQTGRMNRPVDARSDLYALGVTLFELVVGRPPFTGRSTVELFHAHIAKPAPRAHELNPSLPAHVSNLIDALLRKEADERYQSASSLAEDLEACIASLDATGQVEPALLRTRESTGTLVLPERLYGRGADVTALGEAVRRVADGSVELVAIRGQAGSGKSALAREAERFVAMAGGRMVLGKASALRRATAAGPLIDALRSLVEELLMLTTDALEQWRTRLRSVLGASAAVITEILPQATHVLGPVRPLDDVSPVEAENRFGLAVLAFVRAFARPGEPLVILIDDLQWADRTTLQLLERIASDGQSRHVLLLVTYRDGDPDARAVVEASLERAQEAGGNVTTRSVGPLDPDTVAVLLADAMQLGGSDVRALATILSGRTGGNAFVLRRYMADLAERGIFEWDGERWRWDADRLRLEPASEDALDFLRGKLAALPEATREALRVATCIGSEFSLDRLAAGLGDESRQLLADLRPALDAHIVVAASDIYWPAGETTVADTGLHTFVFRFAHDRIAQAVQEDCDRQLARAIHDRIARWLQSRLDGNETADTIFELVGHCNVAGPSSDESWNTRVRAWNARAGAAALASAAYRDAYEFLRAATSDLAEPWTGDRNELHLRVRMAARAAYLAGDHAGMEQLVVSARRNADSLLDELRAESIRIEAFIARNEHLAGVEAALAALDRLGVKLPAAPQPADVGATIQRVMGELMAVSPDDLLARPRLGDPQVAVARQIAVGIASAAYLSVPNLLPLLTAELVASTLTHGVSRESAYGFAVLALVLCAVEQFDAGRLVGEIAMRLVERDVDLALHTRTRHVYNTHVRVFFEPVVRSVEALHDVIRLGVETGDLEFSCWAAHNRSIFALYSGKPLDETARIFADDAAAIARYKQLAPGATHQPFQQLVFNLQTRDLANPATLCGEFFDEVKSVEALEAIGYRGALFLSCVAMMAAQTWLGQSAVVRAIAERGESWQDGAAATLHVPCFYFLYALACLDAIELGGAERHPELTRNAARARDRLASWVNAAPANHSHRLALLDAEIARTRGDRNAALECFAKAIKNAQEVRHPGEHGLALERAARLHEELADGNAAALLRKAVFSYERWGAAAVVQRIGKRLDLRVQAALPFGMLDRDITVSQITGADDIDFAGLMRAAQAISTEIQLDTLLAMVMRVVMENAGATMGALLMGDGESWTIRASERASSEHAGVDELPMSVVRYVARTNHEVLLPDARSDDRFSAEASFQRGRPISVLCCPVTNQGRRSGIIYLENDLARDAFTQARVEVVGLLARQAAISIVNAQLYEQTAKLNETLEDYNRDLEKKVETRTQELSEKNAQLSASLKQISEMQTQIVMQEKLASLGALARGIAHEIQNPLNFVNNFAEVTVDLTRELVDEVEVAKEGLSEASRETLGELCSDLGRNAKTILEQGVRIGKIVDSMLSLSRASSGAYEVTRIHDLIGEYVNLADKTARSSNPPFEVSITYERAPNLEAVRVVPASLGRAVLNVANNAFDAMRDKAQGMTGYAPTLRVTTRDVGDMFEIVVRDDGTGIPDHVLDRVFIPFFTTKPTGTNTGLGMSVCHEIIVQEHKGSLSLDTRWGEFTEVTMRIPKTGR